MNTSNDKRHLPLNMFSLLVGGLITIIAALIAALIPFVFKYTFPEHLLEYEVTGPIEVDRTTFLRLVVQNRGEKPERNVRIWIKAESLTTSITQKLKFRTPEVGRSG